MYLLNRLSVNKQYLISGHPGQWHFSRVSGEFAVFYKFAQNNRRISIKLTLTRVQEVVWERISLDMSSLEAFCE